MIKWKYKPNGFCPVQAEGYFMGWYFYFRSRWSSSTIEFSKTELEWENGFIHARYVLLRRQSPEAGWISHSLCKYLVWLGCVKFFFNFNKKKLV